MKKIVLLTLVALLSLCNFYGKAQSLSTQNTEAPKLQTLHSNVGLMRAPTVNDTETWGEWSLFATGTYVRGNSTIMISGDQQQFATSVYIRQSTVEGHENLFQLKIEKAYADKDLILWWEKDETISSNSLTAEKLTFDYEIPTYSNYFDFKSVAVSSATFNHYIGEISFNSWYCIDTDASRGLNVSDYVKLDGYPEFDGSFSATKPVYATDESKATFNFSLSDIAKTIRYYVESEIDAEFSGNYTTLSEADFLTKDYQTVAVADGSVDVDITGYQRNYVYVQIMDAQNKPIYYLRRTVYSTQSDGLKWVSLGEGDFTDTGLKSFFGDTDADAQTWQVEVQQCSTDATFFRMVNPYTTSKNPYAALDLNETYSANYTSYFDTTQDYYVYFKTQTADLNAGETVVSYIFPTGIYFKSNAGALSSLTTDLFTTCTEKRVVASAAQDASITLVLPGYIDYSVEISIDDNDVATITPASDKSVLKYQITTADKTVVDLTNVPSDLRIDLNDLGLTVGFVYNLQIYSYDSAGTEQDSQTTAFSIGMTEWTDAGSGVYTYQAWASGTAEYSVYRRTEKANANHVQYKLNDWFYGYTDGMVIDIADISNLRDDDNGNTNVLTSVTVPVIQSTYSTNYGNVKMADAYYYLVDNNSENADNLKDVSSFNTKTGAFSIYMAYYVSAGYFGLGYENFQLSDFENNSVNNIVADEDSDAPVEYYNLQGVRVDNPEHGIFIRRQGAKATKVIK